MRPRRGWLVVAAGLALVAAILVLSRGGASADRDGSASPSTTVTVRAPGDARVAGDFGEPFGEEEVSSEPKKAPVLRAISRENTVPVRDIARPNESRTFEGTPRPAEEWDAEELDLPEGEEYRDPEWEWPEDEEPADGEELAEDGEPLE